MEFDGHPVVTFMLLKYLILGNLYGLHTGQINSNQMLLT